MVNCESLPGCPFFNDKMANMPSMTALYKKNYCEGGDFEKCARYMVSKTLGKQAVPPDLFPNQTERARELIAGH